jgi:hypothetical protein
MDEMRYRKPSVKTVLGITKMKKRLNKTLGINKLLAPFRAVGNYQRRLLRRAGYYSPEMKALRAAKRGQVAGPIGALELGTHEEHEHEHQSPAESVLLPQPSRTVGKKNMHAAMRPTTSRVPVWHRRCCWPPRSRARMRTTSLTKPTSGNRCRNEPHLLVPPGGEAASGERRRFCFPE